MFSISVYQAKNYYYYFTQKDATSCKLRNGGCDHMCTVRAEGHVQCSCQAGWQLDEDARSCVGESSCSLPALYYYITFCLLLIGFNVSLCKLSGIFNISVCLGLLCLMAKLLLCMEARFCHKNKKVEAKLAKVADECRLSRQQFIVVVFKID